MLNLSVTLPVIRYCAPRITSVKTITSTNEPPVEVVMSLGSQKRSEYFPLDFFSHGFLEIT